MIISSVCLSCQNSGSFWTKLSDTWWEPWAGPGAGMWGSQWVPSSWGCSLCCPFSSHQVCCVSFPRQAEKGPSKVWISSSSDLWPWRHFWVAQAPAVKISPISSREWSVKIFAKTIIELGNLPLFAVSRDGEFHRDKTSPQVIPQEMISVIAAGCSSIFIFYLFCVLRFFLQLLNIIH